MFKYTNFNIKLHHRMMITFALILCVLSPSLALQGVDDVDIRKDNVLERKYQTIVDKRKHKESKDATVQEDATTEEDPAVEIPSEDTKQDKDSVDTKEDPQLTKHKEKIEKMMNERFGGMNTDSQQHNNFNPREHKYDEKYELEFDPDEEHEAIDEDSSSKYGHDEL